MSIKSQGVGQALQVRGRAESSLGPNLAGSRLGMRVASRMLNWRSYLAGAPRANEAHPKAKEMRYLGNRGPIANF